MEMQKNENLVIEAMKNEKRVTKREPNYRGIRAMPFVMGNETFEKLGTVGSSSNLLVYLTSVFHLKTIAATNLLNIFSGTCNLGALIGAYLSDTYFGRYKMLGFASVSSFLGMLVLALTAIVSALHPVSCGKGDDDKCEEPTAGQMGFLLTSFVLLVVGASGIRPCNLAFGADQFNPSTEAGRRGTNSFFNWYYFTYTFAVMVSMTTIVYVQSEVSWSIGLAIPAILMFFSCVLFFAGSKIYVKVRPQGSPLRSLMQVIVAAIKKSQLSSPIQPCHSLFNYFPADSINLKLPYTNQLRFLEKAAIITPEDKIKSDGSAENPWRLCSIQQIEEVKCVARLIPIWIAFIVFFVSVVQQQNFVVFQALQSNRRLGNGSFKIPAATYNVFPMLALTIWLPIYDRIVVPSLRRYTRNEDGITLLQRMGIGMFLSVCSMLLSALVEVQRRKLALTKPTLGFEQGKGAISSMSAWWFIPQLSLVGLAEGFTFIGVNELFYKQFPENMRSIAASVVLCGVALSSYLSTFIMSIVDKTTGGGPRDKWLTQDLNKGKLDNFYYLIAAIMVVNLGYFLLCAKWYKYKGTDSKAAEVSLETLQSVKLKNHV